MMMSATGQQKPVAFWVLAGACALFACLELLFLSRIFFAQNTQGLIAVSEGQRLRIFSADGRIEGKIAAPKTQATEPASATPQAGSTPKNTEAPSVSEPKAPSKSQQISNNLSEFIADATEEAQTQETENAAAAPNSNRLVGQQSDALDSILVEPKTNASLAILNPDLLEQKDGQALPKTAGNITPLAYYSRPFPPLAQGQAVVAIMVSDLGGVKAQTESALALDKNVTLAFSPYARHRTTWLESARNKGHEAWLMLPAQPSDYPASDAGPLSMLIAHDAATMRQTLETALSKAQAYSGVLLTAGEGFSKNLTKLQALQKLLAARGLGLAASHKPENAAASGWFKRQEYAYAAEFLIDETISRRAIEQQLKQLENHAQKHGKAMGVIRGYPLSISLVKNWISSLPAKGITLAPVSALMTASHASTH